MCVYVCIYIYSTYINPATRPIDQRPTPQRPMTLMREHQLACKWPAGVAPLLYSIKHLHKFSLTLLVSAGVTAGGKNYGNIKLLREGDDACMWCMEIDV